ncbi:MAG: 50S ribosomal protein L11 methyltransferase [Oxalobacter sp.]|nr:MAG: 50S ribosomal protein L11 methyltransferase [Oxalobacter sp.]
MAWNEIVIEVARDHAEPLSDAFMQVGAVSVSIEDADEGTAAETPLFGEPGMVPSEAAWDRSRVVVLTEETADPQKLIAQACRVCGMGDVPPYILRPVAEQDWVRLTQSQFDPIHIGKNIWVVPSWHEAPDPDALILELDPGLAFGTGSHATTRLCMEWLEANPLAGKTVLDYGCGSGILAMVAKKLKAAKVLGVDIDPQAIVAARENAVRNQCEIDYYLPDDFIATANRSFDIVVANILSSPLKLMAQMLSAYVRPGGWLVLSGILERQAEEVAAVYAPYIPMRVWRAHDGWVALCGQRPTEGHQSGGRQP